jgi:hypothetical protein
MLVEISTEKVELKKPHTLKNEKNFLICNLFVHC